MAQLPHGWIWDPFRILDLRPLNGRTTCIGEARTRGNDRCRFRLKQEHLEIADEILRSLALNQPTHPHLEDSLRQLARHLLCTENHTYQADDRTREFSDRVRYVAVDWMEKQQMLARTTQLEEQLAKRDNASESSKQDETNGKLQASIRPLDK